MKAISIMLLGAGLWMGLASCEMKDEILGDKELSGETGTLALGVVTNDATNTVVTKADAGDATINAFPVTIYDATGEVYESYAHYSEMPAELRMPVGEYRVEAYSDGEFKTEMTEPWFKGEESFSIVKDGTNHVEIECEMQNLPITIEPDGDFLNEFQSGWTITLDDGKGSVLTFTNKDTAPYKKYWKIAEGVTSISVNVEATSSTGDKVTQHYTCTKKNAAEEHPGDTDNFVGGDALVIKLSPEVAEVTLEMTIGISVDLSFVEQPDETVEIPVEIEDGTGETDPDDPEGSQDEDVPCTFGIVAQDGSGDYTTIQAAIDAVADGTRGIIFIRDGIYDENIYAGTSNDKDKYISLIGESRDGTILTSSTDRGSGNPQNNYTDCAALNVYVKKFYAENLTIRNTAGNVGQAEALYTAGDAHIFNNCTISGFQDTYKSNSGSRGYFYNCLIEGTTDFTTTASSKALPTSSTTAGSNGSRTAPSTACPAAATSPRQPTPR